MDIDSVLTALALDNATVNLDGCMSMGQNFYIYGVHRISAGSGLCGTELALGGLSRG